MVNTINEANAPPTLVKQVARLIQSFNQKQLTQLLVLTPKLQTIQSQPMAISPEQADLIAYFDHQLESWSNYPPLQANDIFVDGLTVNEFFTLPEVEQDRIWHKVHAEEEAKLKNYEHPIQTNAISA